MSMNISRETVKYIAAAAMLADHFAVIFLPEGTFGYVLCRMAGGMTAITMCYFLAEGFRHTACLHRYKRRLLIFALLAQVPYQLAFAKIPMRAAPMNMLFNLYFSLCFLELTVEGSAQSDPHPAVRQEIKTAVQIIRPGLPVLLAVLCCLCDWSFLAPAYVLLFFRLQQQGTCRSRAAVFRTWAAAIALNALMCTAAAMNSENSFWWCAYLSLPGQICSFILIENGYHGRQLQGNRRFHKWFFYLWYPLHLLMLWVCAIVSTLA